MTFECKNYHKVTARGSYPYCYGCKKIIEDLRKKIAEGLYEEKY
jgi:hypothetical protein